MDVFLKHEIEILHEEICRNMSNEKIPITVIASNSSRFYLAYTLNLIHAFCRYSSQHTFYIYSICLSEVNISSATTIFFLFSRQIHDIFHLVMFSAKNSNQSSSSLFN